MSSMVPPAASTAAFTFSQTWRVCSVMSPMPAMVPSGRRAVIPETKTSRPLASITVAWEKTPLGLRSFGLDISSLGMGCFLDRGLKRIGHAELARVAGQHGNHGSIETHRSVRALASLPLGLAGREQLGDTRRPRAGANARSRGFRGVGKASRVAEMRNIDGQEKMRAVVRRAEVAIEWPHLAAGGARGEQATQEIDDEGKPEAFRAAGREQHAGNGLGCIRGGAAVRGDGPGRWDRLLCLGSHADLAHGGFARRHVEHDRDLAG